MDIPTSEPLSLRKVTLQSLCQWADLGAAAPIEGRGQFFQGLYFPARVKPEAPAPPTGLGQNYNG